MDKRIERSIEENKNLSDEFRAIAKTCFGRIFDMLGKRNFERWIDKRELSDRIKELVIESMTLEDEEKHPDWAGFYTRGTNQIRIKSYKNLRNIEDTATHEKLHFITDKGNTFPTFIDEGLTEYMKGMAEDGANTYVENVATVEFLHKIFGDSLIKAYLIGKPVEFNKKFAGLLENSERLKQDEGLIEVRKFYEHLKKFQEFSDARKMYLRACDENNAGKYTEEEKDEYLEKFKLTLDSFSEIRDDLNEMFQRLVVAKISKMAKDLQFYRNGTLDLEYATQEINSLLVHFPGYHFDKDYFKIEDLKDETFKLAVREVVENSHLVAYDDGEKREQKIDMFIDRVSPKVEQRRGRNRSRSKAPSNFRNDDPIFIGESEDVVPKLLHILVEKQEISTIQYLEHLANIQNKFDISDDAMRYILLKHNFDRFGTSPALGDLNVALLSVFPTFRRLSLLKRERDEDTITSFYSELDFNRFVEKRDNQKFFIEFDENGEISEQELCFGSNLIFSRGQRLEINYKNTDSKLRAVEIRDSSGKIGPIHAPISLEQLKELKLVESITRGIAGKISRGTYVSILDDGPNPYSIKGIAYTNEVDGRSREINWDEFIQDFKNIAPINSQDVYLRGRFQMELTENLLDSAYGFYPRRNERGMLVRDDEIDEIYGDIVIEIDRILERNLSGQQLQNVKQKIAGLSSKLNEARRQRVLESSKTAAIHFRTDEAKKEYFEQLAKKNQERITNAVRDFDYGEYVETAANIGEPQLQLSGVYTTSDIDTRDRILLLEKFTEAAKTLIKSVPEEQQSETFENMFSRMIKRAYGIGERDLKNNRKLKSSFDCVKTAVGDSVFLEKDLEFEVVQNALDDMNAYHKQTAENNKKVAAVVFKDEKTRRMYDVIVALTKENVSLIDMQEQVRTLIDIHNNSKKIDAQQDKQDSHEIK